MWPAEARWVGTGVRRRRHPARDRRDAAGGITCFSDMYYYPDVVGEVGDRDGIRAAARDDRARIADALGRATPNGVLAQRPGASTTDSGASRCVTTAFAPHAPYSVGDATLRAHPPARRRARACRSTRNVHETRAEIERSVARTGSRPLARLQELGLVTPRADRRARDRSSKRAEIDVLATAGASVVHCPRSNLKLASGACPVAALLRGGRQRRARHGRRGEQQPSRPVGGAADGCAARESTSPAMPRPCPRPRRSRWRRSTARARSDSTTRSARWSPARRPTWSAWTSDGSRCSRVLDPLSRAGLRCVEPRRHGRLGRGRAPRGESRARCGSTGTRSPPRPSAGVGGSAPARRGRSAMSERRSGRARQIRGARSASGGIRTGRSRRCTRSTTCASTTSSERVALAGARVLDVGCGGGLLSEALARRGATRARHRSRAPSNSRSRASHAADAALAVELPLRRGRGARGRASPRASTSSRAWRCSSTCRSPRASSRRARPRCAPGGAAFFSTLNRNPKSFALAIVGAEYVLGLLPRGTHEYLKLDPPVRARAWCRRGRARGRASSRACTSIRVLRSYRLGGNVDVNYFLHARKAQARRGEPRRRCCSISTARSSTRRPISSPCSTDCSSSAAASRMPYAIARNEVSNGAAGLLRLGFGALRGAGRSSACGARFLELYAESIADRISSIHELDEIR